MSSCDGCVFKIGTWCYRFPPVPVVIGNIVEQARPSCLMRCGEYKPVGVGPSENKSADVPATKGKRHG